MSSTLIFLALSLAWGPVLVLLHELGHAFAALALTDGEVSIGLNNRSWALLMGHCSYEPARLRSPRAEVWILAAGPAVSLIVGLGLAWAAVESGLRLEGNDLSTKLLLAGAIGALLQFVLSALPVRYGAGLGEGTDESDGRAIWRILTGSPPGGSDRAERQSTRPARPGFVVVLVLVAVVTAAADPMLALVLVAMFGVALWMQRTAPG